MTFRLPKIYPLSDAPLTGLPHSEQVRRLALGGAKVIQLREKQMTGAALYDAAVEAVAVAREHGVRLIINDRVDIAMAVGADGVHLGQDDLSPGVVRRLLGAKAIIGYSTHNLSQVQAALTLPIDYIAIGPVFSTSTKADTAPTVGLDGIAEVRKAIGNVPLVAIGGISEMNAASVFDAGADSVAVISALLCDPLAITPKTAALIERF
jgi:thiamine-phosphate pyrophosphorylase